MANIVIAGCGDVGTSLGLLLAAAGHVVWGLRRSPAGLPSTIKPLAADLGNVAELTARLPSPIDAVFYLAAAGGYDEQRYRLAYQQGVHNMLHAMQQRASDPAVFLLASSTSTYGQSQGEWIDEHSPAEATGFAADYLRAGEELLLSSRFSATVVRFGGIYGPGRTRLLDQLRAGTATCRPGVYSNRIHRDDCAGLLAHLFARPRRHQLYLGVDDQPAPLCEVLEWLAGRLNVAGPSIQQQANPSRRRASNKRCSNLLARRSGYRFRYPSYREGYAAMLV